MQASTTIKIWQKYPIALERYGKYREHWQLGMIQPLKVDDSLWVCNLAARKCAILDFNALEKALTKLEKWSSEQGVQIFAASDYDLSESQWLQYITCLKTYCPEIVLCFFDPGMKSYYEILQGKELCLDDLTNLICKNISWLPPFKMRANTAFSGSFTRGWWGVIQGGSAGEISYVEVISLSDVTKIISNVNRLINALRVSNDLAQTEGDRLEEYSNSLRQKLEAVPRRNRVKRGDGTEHIGVVLEDVIETFEALHEETQLDGYY